MFSFENSLKNNIDTIKHRVYMCTSWTCATSMLMNYMKIPDTQRTSPYASLNMGCWPGLFFN